MNAAVCMLDAAARRFEHRVAVEDEHEALTYGAYRARSLAIASAMLELGGFAFDRGKRRLTAFFTLGGIFFAAAAMAGAQPRDVAITGGALLYLLTQSWPLLRPTHRTL